MSPLKPNLLVHSADPLNAEPPLSRLRASFVTPQQDFYVRCHGAIPEPDAHHRVRIGGRVARPLDLSLDDLKARFAPATVGAVLQCAGNRRSDLRSVKPVSGDPWGAGAIGNAEWTGVALADVLASAGVERSDGLHVVFSGLDEVNEDGQRFRYAVSIPLAKAMAPEVLLAFAMNGAPLAPEHGFPLRALVPGYAGVRSAKWLAAVDVRDTPADTPVQRQDYHLFPPHVDTHGAARASGMVIDDMPLNAAICEPARHAQLAAGRLMVRGYAIATERAIARVDLSADGGRRWVQATLQPGSAWSWTFWEAEIELSDGEHELAVRAWDSAGQTQPAAPDDVWNVKGYLCNAWHRVPVSVRSVPAPRE